MVRIKLAGGVCTSLKSKNITMEILEKDLEDLMFSDLSGNHGRKLAKRGFSSLLTEHTNAKKWMRQVQLGNYGIADIIGYSRGRAGMLVDVIELKNKPLTCADFDQVFRYKKAVDEILWNSFKGDYWHEVRCCLVGPGIEGGHYINNETAWHTVYTFTFSVDGFYFQPHNGKWQKGDGDLHYRNIVPKPKHSLKLTQLLNQPGING